jgi:hypothetical protein
MKRTKSIIVPRGKVLSETKAPKFRSFGERLKIERRRVHFDNTKDLDPIKS